MNLAILTPIFLGIITILQATINKNIALKIGLTKATLLTNIVALIISLIFLLYVSMNSQNIGSIFQLKKMEHFKLWYLLPGIFGVLIVMGIPWSISKFGAIKVTVLLITTQLITSFVWDIWIDHLPITLTKVIGSTLALISVIIMTL